MAGRLLRAVLAFATFAVLGSQPSAQPSPARVVAIGDIHGAAPQLVQILQASGLMDGKGRWSGGDTRLVQTGDFTDRGASVREVMDLLMRLEGEARRAGGQVHVLFGNHEGMQVLREFRDVPPEAFKAFADGRSESRRKRALQAHEQAVLKAGGSFDRDAWLAAHPIGYVEYADAVGPTGRYGRWIRNRKPMLKLGDSVFMHAGLQPGSASTVEEVNRAVETDVRRWDDLVARLEAQKLVAPSFNLQEVVNAAQAEIGRIVLAQKTGEHPGDHVTQEFVAALQWLSKLPESTLIDSQGPLWYRGLATLPEESGPELEPLLKRLVAARFVVGHTPQLPGGRITSRLGGRAVLIDTGMLDSHYKGGAPSALEIANGEMTAIYLSGRQPIEP